MPEKNNDQLLDVRKKTTWHVVQDFLNDFFGCFFPGIFFCLFFSITMLCTITCVYVVMGYVKPDIPTYFIDFSNNSRTEFAVFFIVFSFIMGSLFYRKDPKHPDKISARYIWKTAKDKSGLAVQKINKTDKLLVDYPYHFIYEYLSKRGLEHLAKHIPWRGSDYKSYTGRSKMFINILKIRINHFAPSQNSDIVKNEAHIRLVSSLWYATIWIIYFSVLSGFVISLAILMKGASWNIQIFIVSAGWISLQTILSLSILFSIRKFFHYQRVREIVYVLETASLVEKKFPSIFEFEKTDNK